jgi:hypothetical protein
VAAPMSQRKDDRERSELRKHGVPTEGHPYNCYVRTEMKFRT